MTVKNKLIKLVGLEYYLSIEQRTAFYESGCNTSILIKPDKENPKDKTALEAYDEDWNKIANVSMQDKYIVWMVISNSIEKYVNAHVEKVDAEKNYLYVSIDGFDISNIESQFTYKRFEGLHISSPLLPQPEVVTCLHLSFLKAKEFLENEISGISNNKHNISKNLKFFIDNYYKDISIEADIERQSLIDLMSRSNNPDYEFFIDKLNFIGTHKGSIISKEHQFGEFMMRMEKSNIDRLVKLKYDDEFVEKVKLELSEFPNDLYDLYLQRPNDFFSNVYYSCLTREVITMLFSGIIFIDANGNRNIDKHLNSKNYDNSKETLYEGEKVVPKQKLIAKDDEQSRGIINNKDILIYCINKSIFNKNKAIVWRVLYSFVKTHSKFGYKGNLKDFYRDVCIGIFHIDISYNSITKSKERYPYFNNEELIESIVRKELPEINEFYECVDEYFKSKLKEYIE